MEILFFLFVGYIIFSSAFGKKKKRNYQVEKPQWQPPNQIRLAYPPKDDREPADEGGQGEKQALQRAAALAALKRAQERAQNRQEPVQRARRAINDKNRNRSYNWGERAGPGLFSVRNVLILIGLMMVVLYILSLMPQEIVAG